MNKTTIKKILDTLIYERMKNQPFLKLPEWAMVIVLEDIIPQNDMNERYINECVDEYQELNGCFHFAFDPEDDWALIVRKRMPLFSFFNGEQL